MKKLNKTTRRQIAIDTRSTHHFIDVKKVDHSYGNNWYHVSIDGEKVYSIDSLKRALAYVNNHMISSNWNGISEKKYLENIEVYKLQPVEMKKLFTNSKTNKSVFMTEKQAESINTDLMLAHVSQVWKITGLWLYS